MDKGFIEEMRGTLSQQLEEVKTRILVHLHAKSLSVPQLATELGLPQKGVDIAIRNLEKEHKVVATALTDSEQFIKWQTYKENLVGDSERNMQKAFEVMEGIEIVHVITEPLTLREFDTVIAALRAWQSVISCTATPESCRQVREIAREHGEPLTAAEIDALVERINS